MLDGVELLGVGHRPVVQSALLGLGLACERVRVALQAGRLAVDGVERQAELTEPSLRLVSQTPSRGSFRPCLDRLSPDRQAVDGQVELLELEHAVHATDGR